MAQYGSLTDLVAWQDFSQAAKKATVRDDNVDLINAPGLILDASGQRYSDELMQAGINLLAERNFAHQRHELLAGGLVNQTEQRSAWHTALRSPSKPSLSDRQDFSSIINERERIDAWVRKADTERRWRNIVHIGIGGSDWGVRLAVSAFGYAGKWREVRFVANIDGHAIEGGLAGLDPRETLIVLVSKSFNTIETLENGARAREWLIAAGIDAKEHIAAVTAKPEKALAWGVDNKNIFQIWDWVGGRFSIWSAVSLSTALAVGSDVVAGMRMGASAMDDHFLNADLIHNVPVRMALSATVNRSVLGHGSLNIAPYDSRLANLVPYIQQLDMESLGKSVDIHGQPVAVPTGAAVWGMSGTDAQHTFFQWLHQGSDGAPVDFIMCSHADHKWPSHHRQLLANCLAQREALIKGKNLDQAYRECLQQGLSERAAAAQAPHRVHIGGRPNNLIVLPRLSPYSLGALLALYEHKIFTQAVIWGINPFDQWGVEYGKNLARNIIKTLDNTVKPRSDLSDDSINDIDTSDLVHDASTHYWISTLK